MNVAVLTLTRDRLDYTAHCFERLGELAGCSFTHFVLDQGSTDGTVEWLEEWESLAPLERELVLSPVNVGVNVGLNRLLDCSRPGFDVYVKIDNDCELTQPNTLAIAATLALESGAILSPHVMGLRSVPAEVGRFIAGDGPRARRVSERQMIGGIFMAISAAALGDYRYDEAAPPWGSDDHDLCARHRGRDGRVGYIEGLVVNHYRTTDGQHEDYPEYFSRRVKEGGPE